MALQTVRPPTRDPREPCQHSLSPIRNAGQTIHLSLSLWLDDDGVWRGCLRFTHDQEPRRVRRTADIFCGGSEDEVWAAAHRLRDHHLRDLYQSLDWTEA
jgi:hypothetical protein